MVITFWLDKLVEILCNCALLFRHLGSELNEMVKVIGTLMTGEFERYATADLNRPLLESEDQVLQGVRMFWKDSFIRLKT